MGARVTHQRREVLRAVIESVDHPDARTVLERVRTRMPTISFDTVYRTLSFLEDHDLIGRVRASGERVRFDGNRAVHHHFICRTCGHIYDFESKEVDTLPFPKGAASLGTPESRQLQIIGTCRPCEMGTEDNPLPTADGDTTGID